MHSFGSLSDGRRARLFVLENPRGFRVEITDFGGAVVRVLAANRHGRREDVVLGYGDVSGYEQDTAYFGVLIGRVANRTAHGRFTLDGVTHQLPTNNNPAGVPCHLHGGPRGFHKVLWEAEPTTRYGHPALVLRHVSRDGEEGYPGELHVEVTYLVTPQDELRIRYEVTAAGRATPVNLTNHSYFNLKGAGEGTILDHEVMLRAKRFTPVDATLIPTGELAPVADTPFDFTSPRVIGERIDADHEQLRFAGGYDHNWVLDGDGTLTLAATVREPVSGRTLELFTTEPGVQFYSGNFLDGTARGKGGTIYPHRGGFCLETQHFPNAVNIPHFPSTILRPGETRRSTTVYRFSIG